MADKIKGITVEIGGDTTGLDNALKSTNKEINSTQKELKEVEKLLKLDPTNTTLLAQKQELLGKQVENTTTKLDALEQAKDKADKSGDIDKNTSEYRNLERQIVSTEQSLNKLGEEADKSSKDVKELGDQGEKTGNKLDGLKNIASGVATGITAVTTASVAAATAVVGLAVNAGKNADDLNTLAKQTGMSTAELQKFSYASDLIDVSSETLTKSMAKLIKNMATASKGSGDAYEAFKTLGVEFQNTDGSLRNNQDVFNELIDKLGKMENETQRDALAMQIFGKSAQDLNPLILGGSEALEELGKQAEALGLILSQEALDGANEFNNQIDILKANASGAFTALGTEIASDLLPAMTEVQTMATEMLSALVSGYKEGGLDGLVTAVGDTLSKVVSKIVESLPSIVQGGVKLIQSLVTGIQQNIPMITQAIVEVIGVVLSGLLPMLPQLLQMGIDIIVNLAMGIGEQLPTLIPLAIEAVLNLVMTLLDNIDLIIDAGIKLIMGLANGLIEALPIIIEKAPIIIDKLITAIVDNLPMLLVAALQLIIALAEGIIVNIPELLKAIPKLIMSLVNGFKKYISNIQDIGKMMIQGIFEGISNATQWLYGKLKDWVNSVLDFVKDLFGIESPSKVFSDQVGKNMALGIGVGFTKTMPKVIDEMEGALSGVTGAMQEITIGDIPEANNKITTQNFYTTKHTTATTEVVRQPSTVILEVDKKQLGRVVVPAYDKESNRIGVVMA